MGGVIQLYSKKTVLEVSVKLSFQCLLSCLGIEKCSYLGQEVLLAPLSKYLKLDLIIDVIINF